MFFPAVGKLVVPLLNYLDNLQHIYPARLKLGGSIRRTCSQRYKGDENRGRES
jgi:hypothetical protein